LSYGAVSAALEAWKVYLCKSQVYQAVKMYGGTAVQPRGTIFQSIYTPPLGGPFVLVKCLGEWTPLAMRMDETNQLAVTLRIETRENLEQCYAAIAPIASASGFDLQATDDTESARQLGC
jgi:hypothetical protein